MNAAANDEGKEAVALDRTAVAEVVAALFVTTGPVTA